MATHALITSAQHDERQPSGVTSRRQLLNAAPAVMVLASAGIGTAVAAHAPHSDAALLAACAEFHRLHNLSYLEGNEDWEAPLHERWRVSDEIEDMVPTTQAGCRAKAAVVVTMLDEDRCNGEYMGGPDARIALVTLRNWLGVA